MPLLLAQFGGLDWAVLLAYLGLLIGTGIWFSRRKQTSAGDYFLAGRSMPAWAVAISILATTQSAATFIGAPDQAYAGDLRYLTSSLGGVLAAVLLATVFLPAFYRLNVWTPYQLLETRFGPGARLAASWAYLVGRVFASGSRIFIGSLPAAVILFGFQATADGEEKIGTLEIQLAVGAMTVIGVVYTLAGGIRSVIWADVVQAFVYLATAVGAIVFLLWLIPADLSQIIAALGEPAPNAPSKLNLIDIGINLPSSGKPFIDLSDGYTLVTAFTGFALLTLASHGTDQDLVQRMLTCRDAKQSAKSLISGILIGIPAVAVFLVIGLLLWVYYNRPDLVNEVHLAPKDKTFLRFIVSEIPPGLAGLMMAGLFAAGLSSVNSTLNAMSSTFLSDIYRHMFPQRAGDEKHELWIGRIGVVVAGIAVGGFAAFCAVWYDPKSMTLIDFALMVMNFAYAGLLAVFLVALFTRRGNTASAITALIVGFLAVLVQQGFVRQWIAPLLPDVVGKWVRDLNIAFPWQLVFATTLATVVCLIGRPRRATVDAAPKAAPNPPAPAGNPS